MRFKTLESSRQRMQRSVCPHCGRHVPHALSRSVVESTLGVLAGLALVLILIPLAITAWSSCRDFLSNDASHSVLCHPLEDWILQ